MSGPALRATCLLIALTASATGGCSARQQERVTFYQPVIPRLQRDAANLTADGLFATGDSTTGANPTAGTDQATGTYRWQRGFTWSSTTKE